MKHLLTGLAILSLHSAVQAQTGIAWSGTSGGTLAGSTVTVSGFGSPSILTYDLSDSNYSGAPLSPVTDCMDHNGNSNWTASFSPPLAGVLWYGKYTRGAGAGTGGANVTYTFDQPFTLLSGFAQGSVSGNTLSVPESGFHHGILQFSGAITSLNCTTNATSGSFQACTLGHLPTPTTTYCLGDAASSGCSCGNVNDGSNGDAGCANSVHPGGCSLVGTGVASASSDSVILVASGLEAGQPGLFFRGDNAVTGGVGVVFGDGLRCAGGNVVRLGTIPADASGVATSTAPMGSGLSAGDLKRYQYWYRNPTGSPCGTGFNLSNGLEISWGL